jgi:predicted phosphoribosyltransferase
MGKLRILSTDSEPFVDRVQAGRMLAGELSGLDGQNAVALGILRGGIVVAREIAALTGASLDIVLSRKIGAPMNPELAVGAVSESGELFVQSETAAYAGVDDEYLKRQKSKQLSEIKRRALLFRKVAPKISLAGKTAIMTDDGIATGATMRAALWAARRERPKRLIVAVPVGPRETLSEIAVDADEVIALKSPPYFDSVGRFYLRFAQVEDGEVLRILEDYRG